MPLNAVVSSSVVMSERVLYILKRTIQCELSNTAGSQKYGKIKYS